VLASSGEFFASYLAQFPRYRDVLVTFALLTRGSLSLTYSFGANLANIVMNYILSKTSLCATFFCCRQSGSCFSQFDVVGPET